MTQTHNRIESLLDPFRKRERGELTVGRKDRSPGLSVFEGRNGGMEVLLTNDSKGEVRLILSFLIMQGERLTISSYISLSPAIFNFLRITRPSRIGFEFQRDPNDNSSDSTASQTRNSEGDELETRDPVVGVEIRNRTFVSFPFGCKHLASSGAPQ